MVKFLQYVFLLTCAASAATVQTYFKPDTIRLDEQALWVVEITNGKVQQPPQTPEVDGLQFTGGVRHSSSTHIINGDITQRQVYSFIVFPQKVGAYTVPALTFQVNGQPVSVPSATLTVVSDKQAVTPQVAGKSTPVAAEKAKPVFVSIAVGDGPFFVGESIPASIHLYVLDGLSGNILSLPKLKAAALTDIPLDPQPEASQETLNNRVYKKYTWYTLLSPIKAGKQGFSYDLNMVVNSQQKRVHPSVFDDDDDPFASLLDNFFAAQQQITPASPEMTIDVSALPTEGRPEPFSHAIGQFAFATIKIDEKAPLEGEPLTLTVALKGKGNFKFQYPELTTDSAWKAYAPKAEFKKLDKLGYEGVLNLQYVLVPQQNGELVLPTLNFNYFDPMEATYKVLDFPKLPSVKVAKNNAIQPVAKAAEVVVEKPELLPLRLILDNPIAPMPSRAFSLLFWGLQELLALIVVVIVCLRLHKLRRRQDPHFVAHRTSREKQKSSLRIATQAAHSNDALTFYQCAEDVLRESIFLALRQRPASWNEAAMFLRAKNVPENKIEVCKHFWEKAEAVKFSQHPQAFTIAKEDLAKFKEITHYLHHL